MKRWLGLWLIGYDWRNLIAENDWLWKKIDTLAEALVTVQIEHHAIPPMDIKHWGETCPVCQKTKVREALALVGKHERRQVPEGPDS